MLINEGALDEDTGGAGRRVVQHGISSIRRGSGIRTREDTWRPKGRRRACSDRRGTAFPIDLGDARGRAVALPGSHGQPMRVLSLLMGLRHGFL